LTRIIRHYKQKLEPWKIAHQEALQVFVFEEKVADWVSAIDSILKVDQRLQAEALEENEGGKAGKVYQEWTRKIDQLLNRALPTLEKLIASADRIHYFDYKERKYTPEHFKALLNRVKWALDPEPALNDVLRPGSEVERDFKEGRSEPFFKGEGQSSGR